MQKKRPQTHKAVEFHVADPAGGVHVFKRFDEAAGYAVVSSASRGEKTFIDVLIYSRAGANWWGGSSAVEEYQEDPDASISQRIEVNANNAGRVA